MENELKILVAGNSLESRAVTAAEWKKTGGKIIGIMSSSVPEEVVIAAGMLPWRVTGTWQKNISRASVYRSNSSCGYCNHVLESFLNGDLDFLDGVIVSDIDQDMLRLWDVLKALKVKPFCYAIHVPFVDTELNRKYLRDELSRLITALENTFSIKITDESLNAAIRTRNRTRHLLKQVYELRKKSKPPLSGAEMLGLTTAAGVMPRETFNADLDAVLPYLQQRETQIKQYTPRLLLTSEMLDNPAYIDLVEEACLVAMDDTDTGIRSFNQDVDANQPDPLRALADGYLSCHRGPNTSSWGAQAGQIAAWVKEYNVDGVLGLPLSWCYPQRFRMPFLSRELEKQGIPSLLVERQYNLENAGQIRTRIGAFLEILGAGNAVK